MRNLAADIDAAFIRLIPHCVVGAAILDAVVRGAINGSYSVQQLCTACGLSRARGSEVSEFLHEAGSLELFEQKSELTWVPGRVDVIRILAPMLRGVAIYRSRIHVDADIVEVALTVPPEPSRVSSAIAASFSGSAGLIDTRELLPSIAESAKQRFCIMTPYFDDVGASIVLNLFERAKCPDKTLITRAQRDGSPPEGYIAIRQVLVDLGVRTLNFRIERPDMSSFETFHAKVILADSVAAYVGSTNMNRWSFAYSLELGVHLTGKAAGRIARVVDAVTSVSAGFQEQLLDLNPEGPYVTRGGVEPLAMKGRSAK